MALGLKLLYNSLNNPLVRDEERSVLMGGTSERREMHGLR